MADPPLRRMSASLLQHAVVSECEEDANSKLPRSTSGFMDIQPISELTDEKFSSVSNHSMSAEELEEDDLLEDEEEYLRELEDQRILDEKNGHFEEGFLPPINPTPTTEEAAAYIAASFNAAFMCLESFVGEGNGLNHELPGIGGDASATEGGVGAVSVMIEQPPCRPTDTTMQDPIPIFMGTVQQLNEKATHSLTSSKIQGTNSSFLGMERLLTDDVHGRLDGEAAAFLDLAENRSLVLLNTSLDRQSGPPLMGSAIPSLDHVSSPPGPSHSLLFSAHSNPSPQPNTNPTIYLPPSAQTPQQPKPPLLSTKPTSQQPKHSPAPPQTRSQTRSQQPKVLQQQQKFKLPKPTARFNVNAAPASKKKTKKSSSLSISQPASVLAGREIKATLFAGSSSSQPARKNTNMQPSVSAQKFPRQQPFGPDFNDEDMLEFPPLEHTGLIHTGVAGGSSLQGSSAAASKPSLQLQKANKNASMRPSLNPKP